MHSNQNLTMAEFYQRVIEDFGNRLFNKYNQKEQGFDSEMIDQIKNKVIAKMENPDLLFPRALEIKHCSSNNQIVVDVTNVPNSQVKKEEPDNINQGEFDIDYANVFNPEVKKQEGDEAGVIKHEPEDLDDEKDEEDERDKRQSIERLKNNLGIHIVGTYEPRSKKHVAKDESTKLQLDNVFIKIKNRREEVFVPKLICEFKKQ